MLIILEILYGSCGVLAAVSYGPQILKMMRSPDARRGQSALTWSGWLFTSFITVLYAAVVVKKYEMIAGTGANFMLTGAVCAIIFYQIIQDKKISIKPD